MGNALRWLLTSILILTAILVAAATLVLAVGLQMDLTPLRSTLQREASESLGRMVTISSDIILSGGATPLLVLRNVEVAAPVTPGALGPMTIAELQIELNLPEILRGRTPANGFVLTEVDTRFVTADGEQSFPARIATASGHLSATGVFAAKAEGTVDGRPMILVAQAGTAGDGPLSMHMRLELGATRVEATAQVLEPLSANDLRLDRVTLRYADHAARGVLQAKTFRLLDRRTLMVDVLTISELQSRIHRNEDGRWQMSGDLGNVPLWIEQGETHTSTEAGSRQAGGITLRVGKLVTQGKNTLLIEDPNTNPLTSWNLALSQLDVEDLDTSNPIPVTHLQLNARIDQNTTLSLLDIPGSGEGSQSITVELRGLELQPLSVYTRNAGFSFESGQVDLDLSAQVVGHTIDGTIRATTWGLRIANHDEAKLARTEQALSLGLATGLELLTQEDGAIHWTIPMTGHLDNLVLALDLDIESELQRTFGYNLYATAPDSIVAIVTEVLRRGTGSIAPVRFEAGSATLSDPAKVYLAQVAEALRNQPLTRLKVCGQFVGGDRVALADLGQVGDDRLPALSRERSSTVRLWLIDELRIEPARLIACDPGNELHYPHENTPRAHLGPRVELQL